MEQIKCMTANTAHDLKSPLQTLVLGNEIGGYKTQFYKDIDL